MSSVEAVYRLSVSSRQEAGQLARLLAFEQTVELPEAMVRDAQVLANVLGRVLAVDAAPDGGWLARLQFPLDADVSCLPFLINLSFGNASLLPGVRLVELSIGADLANAIGGPQFGIGGLRERLGVFDRPLLATALKPRGSSVEHLASMAEAFARGGGDLVKDDQNLVSVEGGAFQRRVGACAEAVERGNLRDGGHCAYFPHVSGPAHALEQQLRFVKSLGLMGVLACPLILGLEHVRGLVREHGLALMAHPAWSGGFLLSERGGIEHGLLLGQLFRLAGADITVFPNAGGRFAFSVEQCRSVVRRAVEPWHGLRPTFPAPAGGMQLASIPRMCTDYGADAVFLIGGALLGHSNDLQASTEKFLRAIHEGMSGPKC